MLNILKIYVRFVRYDLKASLVFLKYSPMTNVRQLTNGKRELLF